MKKIVNVCIVYDLDAWPRNPSNNFTFKNCLLEATDVVKSSDTEKYVCSGYGTTFDSAGSWNFVNEFARKDLIFGEDNTSSCHSNNRKNKKNLVLILLKQTQNFAYVYAIMLIIVFCLLMEKKFCIILLSFTESLATK